jgi:hypothetical protein
MHALRLMRETAVVVALGFASAAVHGSDADLAPDDATESFEGTVAAQQGNTLHVTNYGVDSPTCGARRDPCRSISRTVKNARDADTLLVGPGVYGDINRDGDLEDLGEEPLARNDLCAFNATICILKPLRVISTNGAAATSIDVSTVIDPGTGEIRGMVAVDIRGIDVTFGRRDQGFTLLGGETGLIAVGARLRIEGNVSLNNRLHGFLLAADNGSVDASHNIAHANGFTGFSVRDLRPGKLRLIRNVAVNNLNGFRAFVGQDIPSLFRGNVAQGNTNDGFSFAGSPHRIVNNIATQNGNGFVVQSPGITISRSAAISNAHTGVFFPLGSANSRVIASNIFGNSSGCGVQNFSEGTVDATNNFWGATSGPGADPADDAGPDSGCDGVDSATIVSPFAQHPFAIEP